MPLWVYWSFAIGLFLYQTFDAVDARKRTFRKAQHRYQELNVRLQKENTSERAIRRAFRSRYAHSAKVKAEKS